MYDLAITNGLVYIDNQFQKTNIYIKDGIIKKISPKIFLSDHLYDALGDLVLPGIIDPHTHFDLDLGHIHSKDNFNQGTKAAAFGGVTTIIDFLEPVDNGVSLRYAFKDRSQLAKNSVIDYKFHACVKNPVGKVDEISLVMEELGLDTVKLFTTYSDSNRRTFDKEIEELLIKSKELNFMVTAHIENDSQIILNNDFTYKDLPSSRPTISETSKALELAKLADKTKGNLYMVHLSSGETLQKLKEQYGHILNKNFIIESCPHYFVFSQDVLEKVDGYLYTMAPPLRKQTEVNTLIKLIDDVYIIGTDHCSFNKADKNKLMLKDIPLGIGGIENSFDIMYHLFGEKIIDKMTKNVAIAHKLFPHKGIIKEGSDADIFIYHLEDSVIEKNHGNTDYSVYLGLPKKGRVVSTISRGKFVVKNEEFIEQTGKLLNIGGTYNVRN